MTQAYEIRAEKFKLRGWHLCDHCGCSSCLSDSIYYSYFAGEGGDPLIMGCSKDCVRELMKLNHPQLTEDILSKQ